jgi:hypothetical protein
MTLHALQFVPDKPTAERVLMHEPCVLFQFPGFVDALKEWVVADGDFRCPNGKWLSDTMDAQAPSIPKQQKGR